MNATTIPSDKQEIPTPEMARRFPHLRDIANEIPQLDENAEIHLLIGRDDLELLKVREFRNGPTSTLGSKDIFRLDDNRTDVPRPCWSTHTRARLLHQSPSSRLTPGRCQQRRAITNSCHALISLK